jgi:hypothetical protein
MHGQLKQTKAREENHCHANEKGHCHGKAGYKMRYPMHQRIKQHKHLVRARHWQENEVFGHQGRSKAAVHHNRYPHLLYT